RRHILRCRSFSPPASVIEYIGPDELCVSGIVRCCYPWRSRYVENNIEPVARDDYGMPGVLRSDPVFPAPSDVRDPNVPTLGRWIDQLERHKTALAVCKIHGAFPNVPRDSNLNEGYTRIR